MELCPPHPLPPRGASRYCGAAAAAQRTRWLAADIAERSASRTRACACGHGQIRDSLEIEGETLQS